MRIIVLLLLLSVNEIEAQLLQNLRGRVVDKDTQLPILGVSVNILNSHNRINNGIQTSIDGYFRFEKLPLDKYVLSFSMVGYTTVNLSNIELSSGKETSYLLK